jgi:hypothetical protein
MSNLDSANQGQDAEPDRHHRPEQIADDSRAEALDREQYGEDCRCDRQYNRGKAGHRDLQPFNG